jgi:hypothetical protein
MSSRFVRMAGALRGALAAARGVLPGVASRPRAGVAAHTAVLRRIKQCLGVLALMALGAAILSAGSASAATAPAAKTVLSAGSPPAATPPTAKTRAQWKAGIAHLRQPGKGCYRAAYPALRWHTVKCVRAPRIPMVPGLLPRRAHHAGPAVVGGGGTDYSAQVSGLISQATGTFQDVSPGITEQGSVGGVGPSTANAFTLQLNTQYFSGSPACDGSSDPSNCQAWQQFLYFYQNSAPSQIFMQYWLLNYDATCPSSWWTYGSDCFTDSPSADVSSLTASQLATVALTGSAFSGGIDGVSLAVDSGQATSVTNSDSMLDLAAHWNTTQWGVYGDGSGAEAYFGPGTTLQAQTALTDSSSAAPSCVEEGFTGEGNNLTQTSTPALGSEPSPTMASQQTNGATGSANCSVAPGTPPALIGVLTDTGTSDDALVKQGALNAPWTGEYDGTDQIVVATDAVNGPLIGVVTGNGVAYVKEGGLSAPWVEEATNVSQLALASDPANGPLIGVVTYGGEAYVKEGSLYAGWTDEYSGASQLALASDPVNGPLIGVITTGGEAYVKEGGLGANWSDEYSGASQLALASDPVNGPLIGVITTGGDAYVKEGGLSANWSDEYNGVFDLALASDPVNGPLITVLTPGDDAYTKQGALNAGWSDEYDGAYQVADAG